MFFQILAIAKKSEESKNEWFYTLHTYIHKVYYKALNI